MQPARQSGFTMIEMIIVIVVLGMIGTWGSSTVVNTFSSTQTINREQQAIAAARYALERMGREIRETGYVLSANAASIGLMSASQLDFTRSGLGADTSVSIAHSGTDLTLAYPPAAAEVLARDISAFTLSYFDVNHNATAVPAEVRYVRIDLTVAAADTQALSLSSQVGLRNP